MTDQIDMTGATPVQNPTEMGVIDMSNATPMADSPVPITNSSQPGWFQSTVQQISKPFLNAEASAATVGEGAAWGASWLASKIGVPGADEFSKNREKDLTDLAQGVDVPYLGSATPWGSQIMNDNLSAEEKTQRTAFEIAGDGANIASWFLGNPAEAAIVAADKVAGTAAMDLTAGAINTAKSGFMNGVLNTVKEGLPYSIFQSAGAGLTDLSKGKDANTTGTDVALNLASNMAGFAFMGGAMGLIRNVGTNLIKDATVKAANRSMVDSISSLLGVDPSLKLSGEGISHTIAGLKSDIESAHHQLVQGMANVIDTKAPQDTLWGKITGKFSPWVKSLFDSRDAAFARVGIENPDIQGGFPSVLDVISKSKTYLDSVYNTSGGDLLSKLKETGGKGFTPEQFNALQSQGSAGITRSPLYQYISKVSEAIGEDGKNILSLKDIQSLIDQGDLVKGETTAAQGKINSIQKLLRDDSMANLRKDSTTAMIADLWTRALAESGHVSAFMKGKIAPAIKAGTEVNDFVTSLFSGKAPIESKAQEIVKGLGGVGSEALDAFSELIRNTLVRHAVYTNADPMIGGKMIEDFLGKWKNTGILNTKDFGTLTDFASVMKQDFGSIVDGVRGMIERTAPKETTSEMASLPAKAENITTKQGALEQAQTVKKALGTKPLFNINSDGSYDMVNAVTAIKKANTGGQFDGLLTDLDKLANAKTPSQKNEIIKKIIVSGGAATGFAVSGHPWIGYSFAAKTLLHIGNLMNLPKEKAAELTNDDIAKWVLDLVGKKDSDGKDFITPTIMTSFVSGDYDKAVNALIKSSGKVAGQVVAPGSSK